MRGCGGRGVEWQRDEKQFVVLLKEVETLVHALGVGRHGKINTGLAAAPSPAPPAECDRSR